MTCVAALVHKNKVYMAADSAGVAGLDITTRKDKKIFHVDGFMIGFTTSFRMGQLLGYKLSLPKRHPDDDDIMRYMVTEFVEAVRDTLSDGGFTKVSEAREEGGNFLVGYEGRLFSIDNDFQVGENICGYDAVGCGAPYALGSLRNSVELSPKERLRQALETAEEFSAGVSSPFLFEDN